jgi:hypothetical protein
MGKSIGGCKVEAASISAKANSGNISAKADKCNILAVTSTASRVGDPLTTGCRSRFLPKGLADQKEGPRRSRRGTKQGPLGQCNWPSGEGFSTVSAAAPD